MSQVQSTGYDGKRIAKNTTFLYIRMLLTLVISLYTGRIVLAALGIVDYGLYNVIGGLITIFTFINNSMAQASQRFLAYELGSGSVRLSKVFSTSIYVHLLIAAAIVVLGETIGLWYVYNVAVIPPERFTAAIYIYQFSILIAVATVITVPYNALIIAHEKMAAFAYLSLLEVVMKLIIAWLLMVAPFDKLIFYGLMMAIVAILMRVVYGIYAARNFPETRSLQRYEWKCVREMGSFAGWSMMGSLAAVGYTQGLNLLLNFFFSPVVNAARGVSVTVQAVIRSFSGNFQMAVNPQITKLYAAGEHDGLLRLVYKASRFTGCLYLLVAIPVFIEIDTLLSLWLVEVPAHTSSFIRFLLLVSMIEVLASPVNVSVQATGRIRDFEVTVGVIMLMVVPISYVVYRFVEIPEAGFLVFLILTAVAMIVRLMFARRMIGVSLMTYFTNVVIRLMLVAIFGAIVPLIIYSEVAPSLWRVVAVGCSSVLMTATAFYCVGITGDEREALNRKIKQKF